jgi:hypothetical protein
MESGSITKSAYVGVQTIHAGMALENAMWAGFQVSRSIYISLSSNEVIFE